MFELVENYTPSAEIKVIEEFLPRQLDEAETAKAVDAAIASTGAESIRDMGRARSYRILVGTFWASTSRKRCDSDLPISAAPAWDVA